MIKLKLNSWKGLIIHIGLAIAMVILFILFIFKLYLPIKTNHGESITVPDITGKHVTELDDFLDSKDLRYIVTVDSGFSPDLKPLTVLKQFPKANSSVKENRKIYVTLNAEKAPLVKLPDLRKQSLKNALLHFKSLGIHMGEKKYVPGLYLNTIQEFSIDGEVVEPGDYIPKGSVVDVTIENGLGKQSFQAPDVIGLDLESAEFAILGSGLEMGEVTYVETDSLEGRVVKQIPTSKNRVRVGQIIDLWVSTIDSIADTGSILDTENNE